MENRPRALCRSPRTVEDETGRAIHLERRASVADADVTEMYRTLDGRCRAMGIPPVTDPELAAWLESLEPGLHVVAKTDGRVVGHAVLLDADAGHELAIFVHQDFQNAGVGTELLRTLLGEGRAAGISSVWLSVACGNGPAKRLFRTLGFSVTERSHRQLTMEREL